MTGRDFDYDVFGRVGLALRSLGDVGLFDKFGNWKRCVDGARHESRLRFTDFGRVRFNVILWSVERTLNWECKFSSQLESLILAQNERWRHA